MRPDTNNEAELSPASQYLEMAQLCLGQARITLNPEAARAFVVLAREYAAKAKALDPDLSVLRNWRV
jgi:hypothetical protein